MMLYILLAAAFHFYDLALPNVGDAMQTLTAKGYARERYSGSRDEPVLVLGTRSQTLGPVMVKAFISHGVVDSMVVVCGGYRPCSVDGPISQSCHSTHAGLWSCPDGDHSVQVFLCANTIYMIHRTGTQDLPEESCHALLMEQGAQGQKR